MNFFRDIIVPPFELIWSGLVWLGAHPPAIAAVAVVAVLAIVVFKRR